MPVKKDSSHVIMSTIYSGELVDPCVGGGELLCLHCGSRYMPAMPAPINMMAVILKEFVKSHKRCKKTEEGEALEKRHLADWYQWHREKRAAVQSGYVIQHRKPTAKRLPGFSLRKCKFGESGEIVAARTITSEESADSLRKLMPRNTVESRQPLPEDGDSVVEVWY